MSRILVDFHHTSLLRSLNMLFGDRLGMEVYRPIGMDWFTDGYWAINDQSDTAAQFLQVESQPVDNTPPLNEAQLDLLPGTYLIKDPGGSSTHKACTLAFFREQQFDYVLCSIPAHIPLFRALIEKYQPHAKLIVQIGNEWPLELLDGCNVLASVKPRAMPNANPIFYHQEFDTDIFYPSVVPLTKKIYSFINILDSMRSGSHDFSGLEMFLRAKGFDFKSYGGQCRDGNMTGPEELANKMRESSLIFHVKDGGDGFGHIIYNAYAVGRPVITRSSFYKDRLAEELLIPGTFIDLDQLNLTSAVKRLQEVFLQMLGHAEVQEMGDRAAKRFREVVNYKQEAEDIRVWLQGL